MEITEVRIKLMEESDDRLQGFCSITFDNSFVVRDLKIIDGTNGPFVAMPSRKLTSHCHQCGTKNHLKAQYCNQCGARQRDDRTVRDSEGRVKLYADIAHPINSQCREMIQGRVITEFRAELDRAKQPGYVSRYDDDYDDDIDAETFVAQSEQQASRGSRAAPQPASPDADALTHHVPPPHIAPDALPAVERTSSGGPHYTQSPENQPVEEGRPSTARKPTKGDFGAGIF